MPEYGTITADIAFGGQFYVLARAADMGVDLGPRMRPRSHGRAWRSSPRPANRYRCAHPEQPDLRRIDLALLHGPAESPDISGRNSVILPAGPINLEDPTSWKGTLDRSPGGTGTSARMATLHARGELDLDVPFVHQGVLGTAFHGVLHERTTVGDYEAVVPSIRGRAWITGFMQHVLQPDDPFPTGLTVGDIWSPIDD